MIFKHVDLCVLPTASWINKEQVKLISNPSCWAINGVMQWLSLTSPCRPVHQTFDLKNCTKCFFIMLVSCVFVCLRYTYIIKYVGGDFARNFCFS